MARRAFLNPDGDRYVLYLYWNGSQLNWNYNWLGNDNWNRNNRGLVPSYLLSRCLSQPPVILPISTN